MESLSQDKLREWNLCLRIIFENGLLAVHFISHLKPPLYSQSPCLWIGFFFQNYVVNKCFKLWKDKSYPLKFSTYVTADKPLLSQTNNGASRASFHVTAGKMQHTVRNGAAHTASHLGPSTVGPRRLAFSFCSMSVKCSVPGVWSLRISALDSRTFCSFST